MNLFNLSLQLNGFPIKKAKEVLKGIQTKNDDEFEVYLEAQKRAIVDYHLKYNSFYKSFGQNVNSSNWDSIPIMTKQHLQQPLKNRLSDDFTKTSIYINKTSGSSGIPFIFAKDKFCHALTWSNFIDKY